MKTIRCTLSHDSINSAIKEITAYKKTIYEKMDILARRLAEEGYNNAYVNITTVPDMRAVDTGELLRSLKLERGDSISKDGVTWYVYTDCKYAEFVEYGTGIVGSYEPHPDTDNKGWEYDLHEHGTSGWVYFKNNRYYWTEGYKARPFMFNAALEVQEQVATIAKEVFGSV